MFRKNRFRQGYMFFFILTLVAMLLPTAALAQIGAPDGEPGPGDSLHALEHSYKTASKQLLNPGEVVTYTIRLLNSGQTTLKVNVADPVSDKMNYVEASASNNGAYDASHRKLSWTDIDVAPGQQGVSLTFQATPASVPFMPTPVMNRVQIWVGSSMPLVREAWLVLAPQGPKPSPLDESVKIAGRPILQAGDVLTYTIRLHNSSAASVTANVSDPLPEELKYVDHSATGGGSYNAERRTLGWNGVEVPAGADVLLTFAVTTGSKVEHPITVKNVASIASAGAETLRRQATIVLMPGLPEEENPLAGSVKFASQHAVYAGDVFTYTILLRNSAENSAVVTVTDPIPSQVAYVNGSAQGAAYDSASQTLTWSGINLPPGGNLPLTFAVTPAETITNPVPVQNQAAIQFNGKTLPRDAWVMLLPGTPPIQPDLNASFKLASRQMVRAGEVFSFTIRLNNVSVTPVTATVVDALPEALTYQDGTASNGGVYDPDKRALTWSDVQAPARGGVSLTFNVTAAAQTEYGKRIVNRASITAEGISMQRDAAVVLVPAPPQPRPELAGSSKTANKHKVGPGEKLTYSIKVHNSGVGPTQATVTDTVPVELKYVEGSARPAAARPRSTCCRRLCATRPGRPH